MANEVYANGMEIACKAAAGKSMAAFPDTCLSPPSPPAGPVPLPYPNTAFASDTTNGSTTVMISGQEIMLKDQSTFKKSTGDEAATKSLGMGVVTHCIQGEASFIAWSMDVKFEGQNVDRHLDLMLHNEQCDPANTPPIVYVDRMAMMKDESDCQTERDNVNTHCGEPPSKEKLNVPDAAGDRPLFARRTRGLCQQDEQGSLPGCTPLRTDLLQKGQGRRLLSGSDTRSPDRGFFLSQQSQGEHPT